METDLSEAPAPASQLRLRPSPPAGARAATRVVLCDDHEIVRDAIKSRMTSIKTVEIVGEATDGREVLEVVGELNPDVVIIDVEMPKRDGIEATKAILKA